ncbi:MAG: baseplate J/gp47 family protein [Ruminiclostridium sp.]|jgi:uncharacterized phage protein gp47/JayE|nr:baseplate J/gp47 family protein [Ruminiclostridium sp.]
MALPEFLQNRTVDIIHREMLAQLPADLDCSEGNHVYNLTRPAAIELAQLCEFILPDVLNLIFPRSAFGEWLDYHAQMRGLTRRPATQATGMLTITGAAGTVIPAGSQFSTAAVDDVPSVFYETTAAAVIPEGGTVEVPTRCVEAGTVGNTKANTIILKAAKISGITVVTNPEAVSGGTLEEDDESLRIRIMELDAAKSVSFVGSVADYKRWSKEVPGVGEVTVIPAQDDSGLVTVVITDSNGAPANEALCDAVYDHIMSPGNPELRFTPPNARLLVTPPETIALSISATVTIAQDSSLDAVLDGFLAQAQTYLATARADGEIRYTQIGKILAGTRGVYDYTGLALNGDAENIDITKTQLPQISRESVTLTREVTV